MAEVLLALRHEGRGDGWLLGERRDTRRTHVKTPSQVTHDPVIPGWIVEAVKFLEPIAILFREACDELSKQLVADMSRV